MLNCSGEWVTLCPSSIRKLSPDSNNLGALDSLVRSYPVVVRFRVIVRSKGLRVLLHGPLYRFDPASQVSSLQVASVAYGRIAFFDYVGVCAPSPPRLDPAYGTAQRSSASMSLRTANFA